MLINLERVHSLDKAEHHVHMFEYTSTSCIVDLN